MTDVATTARDPGHSYRERRRIKRFGVSAAVALILVFILCTISYEVVAHSRYKVFGKADPKTGYRIEYTVSSHYRRMHNSLVAVSSDDQDNMSFNPGPPPQALQWIYTHILRRPASPQVMSLSGVLPGGIDQLSFTNDLQGGFNSDENGYPEFDFLRSLATNMKLKHPLVPGCLASSCECTIPVLQPTGMHCYFLLIKPKDQAVTYEFMGIDGVDSTSVENELAKITASIRITKGE